MTTKYMRILAITAFSFLFVGLGTLAVATPPVPATTAATPAAEEEGLTPEEIEKAASALAEATPSPYVNDFELMMKGSPWYNNCVLQVYYEAQACRCGNRCDARCEDRREDQGGTKVNVFQPGSPEQTLKCFNEKCRENYNRSIDNCKKA